MNVKIAGFCIGVILFLIIAIFLNLAAGCGIHPAIQEARDRQKAIPPPICERVNTIIYGKEAECKHEI